MLILPTNNMCTTKLNVPGSKDAGGDKVDTEHPSITMTQFVLLDMALTNALKENNQLFRQTGILRLGSPKQ